MCFFSLKKDLNGCVAWSTLNLIDNKSSAKMKKTFLLLDYQLLFNCY